MSIYCGASFGGGQGYTDTCGQEAYGKGTPLAQCKQCMRQEIHQLKAENESLRKDAERYRFIRDADRSDGVLDSGDLILYAMESLDEVVDEAMAISSPENP